MARIYITGHRNPDMDSIAAAVAYAALKNMTDSENCYVPAALGPLNSQSRAVLEELGLESPEYLKDVYSRTSSVYRKPTLILDPDDPVYELVNMYNQNNPSVIPILGNGEYLGLLSIDETNRYFLRENMDRRPVYDILLKNIPRVIRGFFLKRPRSELVHAPLMVGAMDYRVFSSRLDECGTKPLLVVGNRADHIRAAFARQLPGIILTGMDEDSLQALDASDYEGFIYVSHEDTAETIRLLRLSVAVKNLLVRHAKEKVPDDMLFESAKGMLTESGLRGLPVFSHETGAFVGFITRRCFLTQPRQKIILVDHNEAAQSVPGLEDAEIVEILDHHRLDAPKTRTPITIMTAPVGSSCTIVYEQWMRSGQELDEKMARLLLCGISSDTVMLKSPTTTIVDSTAVRDICARFSIDYEDFCTRLFSHGSSLSNQDPARAVSGDFKIYSESGVSFGIGQVEVTTFADIGKVRETYISQLEKTGQAEKLEWTMLLVTNVMSEDSMLLSTDYRKCYKLMYEEVGKGLYHLPGVLSRKKQLLPEILRVLS